MTVASNALELAVALFFSLCVTYIFQQTLFSSLKSIPGPFLAKFSGLWQLYIYHQGKQAHVLRRLHNRYGPVVRIGPKHVSLNQPSLIKTVYSLSGDYVKSIRYAAAGTKSPNGHDIPVQFSILEEKHHTKMWRPVAKYYSLSHILSFEAHINNVIRTMERRLEQEFCLGTKTGAICNLHTWLSFAAWEVVMVTSFTQMQGFLKEGKDIKNLVADSAFAADPFLYLGNVPTFGRILRSFYPKSISKGHAALKFSLHQIAERRGLASECVHDPPDFLDNFLDSQKVFSDTVNDDMILAYLISNVTGGGDKVGGTMSAVMYHILKHPRVLKRLQEELDAQVKQTPISWEVASKIPYLDAVIQEAIRFHPVASFTMERVVPREGLILPDGHFIKPGTIVGMHPWVINRDHSIFGRDADFFIPQRWLKKEDEDTMTFTARVSLMKNTMLSFGAGKRACIGKDLALLEMYKTLGTLFASFDIELVEPEKEPEVIHSLFSRLKGFNVTMKPREKNVVP
ncbi:MAG: hypothetical protein Q9213_007631 [Squamulea squamosa]